MLALIALIFGILSLFPGIHLADLDLMKVALCFFFAHFVFGGGFYPSTQVFYRQRRA